MIQKPGFWMAATGDLMMNRPLLRSGDEAPGAATQGVYDLLREADLSFVNLEVPLTNRGVSADKLVTFRADPSVAADLRGIGTDVVTFANNHAFDFGLEGLQQTLETLDSAGIPRVGAGMDLDEALRPAVLTASGLKVAFLGMATTLPAGSSARVGRAGIAPIRVFTNYVIDSEALDETPGTAPYVQTQMMEEDVATVCDAVRAAREQADVVVVGIHWGVPHGFVAPFQDPLATYQRPLAHALIDAGASAVVGNHAHILHGVEWYRGAPILYCLGNFLFHRLASGTPVALRRNFPPYSWKSLRSPINRMTAVARVRFGGSGQAEAVEIVPAIINSLGEPELAPPDQGEEILAMLDDLSRPLGAAVRRQGERGYIEAEGSKHS